MKFFFNILSICVIFSSFGAFKAVGNELDEVICNAMKGMQAKEEKKIPYNIGDYELIGITVDCKKKALTIDRKQYLECARIRAERCPLFADMHINANEAEKKTSRVGRPARNRARSRGNGVAAIF